MKMHVLTHAALGRKIRYEFGMVFVNTSVLYLKKKLHSIDFLQYYLLSYSVLRIEICYSYDSVFMFLIGGTVSFM